MPEQKLTDFIESISGESHLRVQDDLGDGFVRLRAAEAQRRQAKQDIRCVEDVVIEMLRNARDAHATLIFVASWADAEERHITMIDNGDGVPENLHQTVFEPFVTSKLERFHSDRWGVHGRGMALYSIKQNTTNARILASAPGMGSSFNVVTNPTELPEKRDQSTIPTISANEEGALVLKGPHNIIRTTMEFAIDNRQTIVVYLGSPTEIAATIRDYAVRLTGNQPESILEEDLRTLPIIQRFAFDATPAEFAYRATQMGLPMSERSARRILDGQIEPIGTILEYLAEGKAEQGSTEVQDTGDFTAVTPTSQPRRKVSIAAEDLDAFTTTVMKGFSELAQAYYLLEDVEPTVRVGKDGLRINIPLEPLD